ncbi:MAG: hypothetical protein KF680_06250 [Cryobacterium sp.]|nr:hypothetical protein [Cryobacterium sp.]
MRARILMIATLGTLVLSGCSAGLAQAIGDADACRAAAAVSAVPVADPARLVDVLDTFSAEAPEPLHAPIAVLRLVPQAALAAAGQDQSAPAVPVDLSAELEESATHAAALREVRAWVAERCDSRFFMGSLPEAVTDAALATLDDFEVIVGRDRDAVSVAVAGATRTDVAVALCEQAEAAHGAGVDAVSVRVFGASSRMLASNDSGACAPTATPNG